MSFLKINTKFCCHQPTNSKKNQYIKYVKNTGRASTENKMLYSLASLSYFVLFLVFRGSCHSQLELRDDVGIEKPLGSYTKYCYGTPGANPPENNNGYIEANPQLIKEVTNGRLYLVGNDDQQLYMAHVYGTPYEMGYAHGELLKDEVQTFISDVWEYMLSEFPLNEVAPIENVENATLEEALQLTADLTGPFTPAYWYEELQGLSDASGVPYESLLRITMLPELTRAACSMVCFNCKISQA
ncbi:hypothetical protein RFI_23401 [Reticulomyxa filosa]|uniref:Uncharacterized protein n=1 Tax=Reticulomyxa filosa TaxID=46433 RepID=X6MJE5_RETFI|nr:hypothetical protein RFI_23401 [Reticulomyxa filosa]|eukprot:ETO13964.1 hypothetical protein RFI_23401 [Reticulomyxa filosa]